MKCSQNFYATRSVDEAEIDKFISSDKDILLLTGVGKAGKTSILEAIERSKTGTKRSFIMIQIKDYIKGDGVFQWENIIRSIVEKYDSVTSKIRFSFVTSFPNTRVLLNAPSCAKKTFYCFLLFWMMVAFANFNLKDFIDPLSAGTVVTAAAVWLAPKISERISKLTYSHLLLVSKKWIIHRLDLQRSPASDLPNDFTKSSQEILAVFSDDIGYSVSDLRSAVASLFTTKPTDIIILLDVDRFPPDLSIRKNFYTGLSFLLSRYNTFRSRSYLQMPAPKLKIIIATRELRLIDGSQATSSHFVRMLNEHEAADLILKRLSHQSASTNSNIIVDFQKFLDRKLNKTASSSTQVDRIDFDRIFKLIYSGPFDRGFSLAGDVAERANILKSNLEIDDRAAFTQAQLENAIRNIENVEEKFAGFRPDFVRTASVIVAFDDWDSAIMPTKLGDGFADIDEFIKYCPFIDPAPARVGRIVFAPDMQELLRWRGRHLVEAEPALLIILSYILSHRDFSNPHRFQGEEIELAQKASAGNAAARCVLAAVRQADFGRSKWPIFEIAQLFEWANVLCQTQAQQLAVLPIIQNLVKTITLVSAQALGQAHPTVINDIDRVVKLSTIPLIFDQLLNTFASMNSLLNILKISLRDFDIELYNELHSVEIVLGKITQNDVFGNSPSSLDSAVKALRTIKLLLTDRKNEASVSSATQLSPDSIREITSVYQKRRQYSIAQLISSAERFLALANEESAGVDYIISLRKLFNSIVSRIIRDTSAVDEEVLHALVFDKISIPLIALLTSTLYSKDAPVPIQNLWIIAKAIILIAKDCRSISPTFGEKNIRPWMVYVEECLSRHSELEEDDAKDLISISSSFLLDADLQAADGVGRGMLWALADRLKRDDFDQWQILHYAAIRAASDHGAKNRLLNNFWSSTVAFAAGPAMSDDHATRALARAVASTAGDIAIDGAGKGVREHYARVLVRSLRAYAIQSGTLSRIDARREAIEHLRELKWDAPGALGQAILSIIATYNPDYGDTQPGDIIVGRVERIDGENVDFSIPFSNLRVHCPWNLLPTILYNFSRDRSTQDDIVDGFIEFSEFKNQSFWKGRLLFFNVLASKTYGRLNVTARGPQYIAKCLNFLFPVGYSFANWLDDSDEHEVNSVRLWMGGSNSAAVLRANDTLVSSLLSSGGVLTKEFCDMLLLNRLTLFPRCRSGNEIQEDSEIRHFVNNFYQDLIVKFSDDGCILLFSEEPNKYPRKNRTLLSFMRKIFRRPVTLFGFDETASVFLTDI